MIKEGASRVLAVVLTLPVLALAPPASANCIPAKIASTFSNLNYVYIDMGPGVNNSQVVGAFYACGNPSANNGTYAAHEWLFVDLGGLLSMNANLGDARVNGCPTGTLVTRLQTTASPIRFLTMTAVEGAASSSAQYDYSFARTQNSVLAAVPLPRPRVISASRAPGGIVNLVLLLDPTAAGNTGDACGAITGYEVVTAFGSDPGRNPAGWTTVQSVANDGSGTTVTIQTNCGSLEDQFLATRLLFGDGQKSDVVSASTRLSCDPNLAEPRFNVVPKRPAGPKAPGAPASR